MTHSFPPRRSSDLRAFGHDGNTLLALEDQIVPARAGQIDGEPLSARVLRDEAVRLIELRVGAAPDRYGRRVRAVERSEEQTSELQSLMRISYAVFCLKKKNRTRHTNRIYQ